MLSGIVRRYSLVYETTFLMNFIQLSNFQNDISFNASIQAKQNTFKKSINEIPQKSNPHFPKQQQQVKQSVHKINGIFKFNFNFSV